MTDDTTKIQIEAYIVSTKDGGYDILEPPGTVVIHIDGVHAKSQELVMEKIKESDGFRGPLFRIEIPKSFPISVQEWTLSSVQIGNAGDLFEEDDA